ncbi:MAG: hypothetical protein LUE10_05440, partial [Alistipes sp.]|nr:hypothetical protein [Alistipes sp.]
MNYYYGNAAGRIIRLNLGEENAAIRDPQDDESIGLFAIQSDGQDTIAHITFSRGFERTEISRVLPVRQLADPANPGILTLDFLKYRDTYPAASDGIVVGCGFSDTLLDRAEMENLRNQIATF